ncbi:MAG: PilZ domain-containing protein [Candidatus Thiodiazotropha sp. (ex Myrtea spinifera)]|nr:PilZ domain-containing protein [Candidatus Thiodiazotropha sp. (ex Myrtea spinifera)]MCU7830508.1 PilZ domain-containing protein [Candidatus Thiodiazotropha sp. (ex Myrtea sp. 'scaly one' KF741663)]
MKEQRKSPRKIANEILEVTDQITGMQIGRVVNVSADGLMLLSEDPIVTGSVFQMDMMLPGNAGGDEKVSFRAEAVWSTEATQPNSFWTGLHIVDISPEGVLLIDKLILDWYSS